MKRSRIEIVKSILREMPDTRRDANNHKGYAQKKLLIEVWKRELQGKPFTPENLMRCSSPAGVLRDRCRAEVKKEFPLDEDNLEKMVSFRDEFSDHIPYQAGLDLAIETKSQRVDPA